MTDLFDLSGRLALVTGASRGLGRLFATTLAQAGARVVIHGRDTAALATTADAIAGVTGVTPAQITFDVRDAAQVEEGVSSVLKEHGTPDILVNSAGVQRRAPIHEFPVADWDDVIATNLNGTFYVCRFVAPAMVARGSGKIVNIASVQSALARQTIAPYSASKGGIVQLTKGMAADLARFNIQVNAISPGYFATDMNSALVEDEAFTAWLVNRTPARRWGDVGELAGALLYLCSDASSFVSGQNIFVDGGMTAVV